MDAPSSDLFIHAPLTLHNGIPVFSRTNAYTDNYEEISGDHLALLQKNGVNPFISEALWVQAEQSTVELIRKYSAPGCRILDVGVGLGRLLDHFPHLDRYGMDISFGYLKIAQSKGINVCYAMIEEMPYRNDSFDLIVCTDVLEHVLDLNRCCEQILAALKPGGTLIVRVPYRENLAYYASPDSPYRFVHLRNFDEHTLRLLFERILNCEVLETRSAGYLPQGDRLKVPFFFPKRDGLLYRFLTGLKKVRPSACERLIHNWYHPVEINIVVRKRAEGTQNGALGAGA